MTAAFVRPEMNSRPHNPATLSRRELLAAGAVTGSLAALGGCERVISSVTQRLGTDVPESVAVPAGAEIDPAHHLISRAGYGPWPGYQNMWPYTPDYLLGFLYVRHPEEVQKTIYEQGELNQRRMQGRGTYSPAEEIARLAELRDRGTLTAEEFEAQKRKVLGA